MDPISVALIRVKAEIPRDVLQQAFASKRYDPTRRDRYFDNITPMAIDEQIKRQVVEGRVSIDANLVSGTEMYIPLALAEVEIIDMWNMIYRFPREALGGRRIVAVHELSYGYVGASLTGPLSASGTTNSLSVARQVLRGTTGGGVMGTAYVQLTGHNTVLVNDINQLIGQAVLRCTLTHEPNFNDIKPENYHNFGQLVVLATKAHVHNQLVVDLDEGQIRAGMTLGRIREITDQYADANQMYYEYLTGIFTKVMTVNDTEKFRNIMRLSLGSKARW